MNRKIKPRCNICNCALNYIYERSKPQEGIKKAGWKCPKCNRLFTLDSFEEKEMSEREKRIRKQADDLVNGIENGTHYYGQIELSIIHFGERYRLVGDIGLSASVGQMIRIVKDRIRIGDSLVGIIWFQIPVSNNNQNDYLIAFELDYWGGDPDQTKYYVCGGMTDYSGEGGRAYDAMKLYVEQYEDVPITMINLNDYPAKDFDNPRDLINYLEKKLSMKKTSRLAIT